MTHPKKRRVTPSLHSRVVRFVAATAAASFFALLLSSPGNASVASKKLTPKENRFLDAIFDNSSALDIDFTSVGDRELVAAGRAFCRGLKQINGEGANEGTGGPTPDDFESVAQEVAASRLDEVTKDVLGDPLPNGAIVLAYGIGISAVDNFCPRFTDALG